MLQLLVPSRESGRNVRARAICRCERDRPSGQPAAIKAASSAKGDSGTRETGICLAPLPFRNWRERCRRHTVTPEATSPTGVRVQPIFARTLSSPSTLVPRRETRSGSIAFAVAPSRAAPSSTVSRRSMISSRTAREPIRRNPAAARNASGCHLSGSQDVSPAPGGAGIRLCLVHTHHSSASSPAASGRNRRGRKME